MNLLAIAVGVGVGFGIGYAVANRGAVASAPTPVAPATLAPILTTKGQPLDAQQSVVAAYYQGVSDGKSRTPYLGGDVINYLQGAVA